LDQGQGQGQSWTRVRVRVKVGWRWGAGLGSPKLKTTMKAKKETTSFTMKPRMMMSTPMDSK
jgi:hypothetical protein